MVIFSVFQDGIHSRFQIGTMESSSDGQETRWKLNLALRVRDARLIKTSGCLELAQTEIQAVQGLRWACADEWARTIEQGELDLALGSKMGVGLVDVLHQLGFPESCHCQHGSRVTFSVADRVFNDGWVQCEGGELLLCSGADPKEQTQGLFSVLDELFLGRWSSNDDRTNDALTMARSTYEILVSCIIQHADIAYLPWSRSRTSAGLWPRTWSIT